MQLKQAAGQRVPNWIGQLPPPLSPQDSSMQRTATPGRVTDRVTVNLAGLPLLPLLWGARALNDRLSGSVTLRLRS